MSDGTGSNSQSGLIEVIGVSRGPVPGTGLGQDVTLAATVDVFSHRAQTAPAASVTRHDDNAVAFTDKLRVGRVHDNSRGLMPEDVARCAVAPVLELGAHRRDRDLHLHDVSSRTGLRTVDDRDLAAGRQLTGLHGRASVRAASKVGPPGITRLGGSSRYPWPDDLLL